MTLAPLDCARAVMPRSRTPRGRARRKGAAPHPVDVHVGARVKKRREELGMSQGKLGEELGLTFQQVQKYERAANRISASRLYRMGMTLGVDVSYFFEGYRPEGRGGFAEPPAAGFERNPLERPEAIELIEAFRALDPVRRDEMLRLARMWVRLGKPR
jgi:transcriptional regulator with XRE-family HTH domain